MRSEAVHSRLARRTKSRAPTLIWAALFGIWALFISGAVLGLTGSPGVAQAFRLRSLLVDRRAELARIEESAGRMEGLKKELGTRAPAQEAEIRKVLGYAATGELVFEFSDNSDKIGQQ